MGSKRAKDKALGLNMDRVHEYESREESDRSVRRSGRRCG